MAVDEDALAYLVTHGTLVSGSTGFHGLAPDAVDTACVLNVYPGRPPDWIAAVENPGLQAICRAPTKAGALTLAENVMHALGDIASETVGGRRYLQVDATGSPGYMGQDEKQRHLYSVNFAVMVDREV
jgi:hypothetical protein